MKREEFRAWAAEGVRILDGAMGSNLRVMGMGNDECSELWAEAHPDLVEDLLRRYVEAGSEIIYAPTFQAQPKALQKFGREADTESLNAGLAALARRAAGGHALVAGDLATMAATVESWDEANFDTMTEDYRRQIRGLVDGGVDLLVAETLMYPTEAEAILAAAEMEGAPAVLYSFTMQPDGTHRCLYSCASIIFVTVVDNFFDSTLNDCFCTLITWEKRHIELCSFQTSSTEIQNRIQFTVYCIDIFCL